jgi:hypothetical protein
LQGFITADDQNGFGCDHSGPALQKLKDGLSISSSNSESCPELNSAATKRERIVMGMAKLGGAEVSRALAKGVTLVMLVTGR